MTRYTDPHTAREIEQAEPSGFLIEEPDRLWAKVHGSSTDVFSGVSGRIGGWCEYRRDGHAQYVRVDLFDAVTRQRDQMQAEIDRLNAQLKPALEACAVIDAIALAGYDNFRDMVMHMLEAVVPSRAALKGSQE